MKPRVGVSSCLLGQRVRWDGGHKEHEDVLHLDATIELVGVCPEDEVGMGTPREPIKLDPQRRLVGVRSGTDHTDAMTAFAHRRLRTIGDIDGWILKKDSPSCGLHRVKVQGKGRIGRGTFATVVTAQLPHLPVVEETEVDRHFLERVFAHARWARRTEPLHAFHARHKYQLLAHSPTIARDLGRLVASGDDDAHYGAGFFRAIALRRTAGKEANALQHLAGFVRRDIDAGDRAELLETITAYRSGSTTIDAPVALLRHHLRRHPNEWAQAQTFLDPLAL